jgi:uncharacterized DUF497 family protein
MRYTWDEKKARANFEKHGIRFEEAQVVWTDAYALEYCDTEESEERFIRLGLNPFRGILLIVFCEREYGEVIRIISVRKANILERQMYEEELRS